VRPASAIALLAAFAPLATAACGPRTGPATGGPEPGPDAAGPDPAAIAECARIFEEGLARRMAQAEANVAAVDVRGEVVAAALLRVAGDERLGAAGRGLVESVLAASAVRDQLADVVLGAAGDFGAQAAVVTALFNGTAPDVESILRRAGDRALAALAAAGDPGDLSAALLAAPPVPELLRALLPDDPFAEALAEARGRVRDGQSAADARLRLVVPGDVDATRTAVEAWVSRPAGLGCTPLVRRFPLAEAIGDLPSARATAVDAGLALLEDPAVREETVALARDLLADATLRLALDELFVRSLRGDDPGALDRAARAVVASPALPPAVGAWAGRLLARRADLPDLGPRLRQLAADPEFVSVLARFLDVLVFSAGCVEP
jgi:hypothetical protein